ncbi:hypothetical protein HQ585_17660 [candidate division KSB1 bacterium]|nr:hypothetical protein [candidate division KSB1 bacterium]
MEKLSADTIEQIRLALNRLGANKPCPRCGNKDFDILEFYFSDIVQTDLKAVKVGGPNVPSAVVLCKNCGYLSQHALGLLGILPKIEDKSERSKK